MYDVAEERESVQWERDNDESDNEERDNEERIVSQRDMRTNCVYCLRNKAGLSSIVRQFLF